MHAVVLAGGTLERERFPGIGTEVGAKAELPLHGCPMLVWTVRALRQCSRIGRVVVVGDPARLPPLSGLDAEVVPETGEIDRNLRAGLDALPDTDRVLVLSGDLPLLTAEALEDLFLHAPDADVVFPYLERADVEHRFPSREFLYARTRDGRLTGCSAALIKPAAVRTQWQWVERLLGARRASPLRMALMFGLPLAFKLVTGWLTVRDVEERLSSLLHLTGRGYRSRFPELALDVDKETDLAVVEAHLRPTSVTNRSR